MRFQCLMEALADSKIILILCHQNADADALGSAYALSQLISRKTSSKNVVIAAPNGVNRVSKQILQCLPMSVTTSAFIDNVDILILVDTNTLIQLGEFGAIVKKSSKPLVLIDHHFPNGETVKRSVLSITDQDASSTCEIVYDLLEESGLELDRNVALALFLGIAYDTQHFILAKSRTFKIIAKLIDAGLVVEEALPLLTTSINASEKIARLKAAERIQRIKLKEWIVVVSKVGTYQSSAARGLLNLGADVAIVGGERKGKVKISLRSVKKFFEKTHVHLGRDIAMPMGKCVSGMGGGHSTAAGINGEGSLDEALKICVNLLERAVNGSV